MRLAHLFFLNLSLVQLVPQYWMTHTLAEAGLLKPTDTIVLRYLFQGIVVAVVRRSSSVQERVD